MKHSAHRPERIATLFFIAVVLLILSAGVVTQRWLADKLIAEQQDDLLGFAKLKAQQIESFMANRHGDAEVLVARTSIWRTLTHPTDQLEAQRAIKAIHDTQRGYGYRRILLFDAVLREQLNESPTQLVTEQRRALAAAIRNRSVELADFHLLPDGTIAYGIVHPVFAGGNENGVVIGAVYLERDGKKTLLPLLGLWYSVSPSGETLLVRQDGETALYLSPLRFFPDQPPLSLRTPLLEKQYLSVQALSGESGLVSGIDYRGVAVVGAAFPISNTPWIMIAKQDREEVSSLARFATIAVLSAVGFFLLLSLYASRLLWRVRTQSARLEAAAASERHLLALKTSIDGFIVVGSDGRIHEYNAALLDMLGYAKEEIAELNLKQIEVKDSSGGITSQMERIRTSGANRFACHWRCKDGQVIDVEISTSYSQGVFVSFVHDVTTRMYIERERERYLTFFNFSPDLLCLAGMDGRFKRVNAAFATTLGYTEAELLSQPQIEFIHPDDRRKTRDETARLIGGNPTTNFSNRFRCKDGSWRWLQWNTFFDSSDQLIYGAARDETDRHSVEEALRASEAALHTIIANALDAVVRMDATGHIRDWSGQAEAVFGWHTDEVLGRLLADVLVPERYREAHTCGLARLLHSAQPRMLDKRIEIEALHRDGHEFPAELTITRIDRAGGAEFSAFLRDISDRRKREEEFALAATVFDTVDTAVTVTGPDNRIIAVNPAFTTITGYSADEVIGHNPRLLSAGTHPPEFYRSMWASITQTGRWRGEIENRRRDGSFFVEWLSIRQLRDSRGQVTHHVAAFTDISERKNEETRVRHLAHHDALTDLPNRTLFLDRLTQAITSARREQRRLALLFIDLDNFKPVNDTLGHHVGDLLLQQVAQRLLESVRVSDTVARLGGDEFTVLLPLINADSDALAVADKIQTGLTRAFEFSGCRVSIGASIGIALFPDHGEDEESLLHSSDTAMYLAKQTGSTSVVCTTSPSNHTDASS